jgi:hypothetical protein
MGGATCPLGSQSEGASDTHHAADERNGFREALNPSRDLFPDGPVCLAGKSVTGLVTCLSSPVCKNILIFRRPKSVYMFAVLSHLEGRCATSSTRGRMRWTRMVLLTRVLEADGEDVWS